MIEIKWRLREYIEELATAGIEEFHQGIAAAIPVANVSGNYDDLIDLIEVSVHATEFAVVNFKFADRSKLTDRVKQLVQSIYGHCPGLRSAVRSRGSIDSSYLPP